MQELMDMKSEKVAWNFFPTDRKYFHLELFIGNRKWSGEKGERQLPSRLGYLQDMPKRHTRCDIILC
jgi:hypothetical protein